jgi:hypothetical protein
LAVATVGATATGLVVADDGDFAGVGDGVEFAVAG